MATAAVLGPADREGPFTNPWPWMISGLALVFAGFLWARIGQEALTPVRVLLVFLGVIAAGAAVAIRPSSPKVLAFAGGAAFFGAWGLYLGDDANNWDSIRLMLAVGCVVAIVAALILLLPRVGRRIVVCTLVVLHFGGILSAVLSSNPPIWLARVAWTYVYRPYLQFMYLTNAYHFYAPDPGPSFLFWFDIEYIEDGRGASWHWVKVPKLSKDGWPEYPLALQYQRRLALASLSSEIRPYNDEELKIVAIRHAKANKERYLNHLPVIPRNTDPVMGQPARNNYGPPATQSEIYVESYVRHVAYEFKQEHPRVTITGIKLYRLEHHFLGAGEFSKGEDPQAPRTYVVHYWGEFDQDGTLKTASEPVPVLDPIPAKDKKGKAPADEKVWVYKLEKQSTANLDGFLYWQLPFLRVNADAAGYLISKTNQFPKPPEEPAILRKLKDGDTMTDAEKKAYDEALEDYTLKLLNWDVKVDKAFSECMIIPPGHQPMDLGFIFLHAGHQDFKDHKVHWVRYPEGNGTKTEWEGW